MGKSKFSGASVLLTPLIQIGANVLGNNTRFDPSFGANKRYHCIRPYPPNLIGNCDGRKEMTSCTAARKQYAESFWLHIVSIHLTNSG
jgi:hypothetical protein